MAKKKKQHKTKNQKKRFPVRRVVIGAAAAVLLIAAVVFLVLMTRAEQAKYALNGTDWVAQSAKNASGDEVDVREVYQVRYAQYRGTLSFDDTHHFSLWLQPGDASEGTHTGTYEIAGDKAVATFDSGDVAAFPLVVRDGQVMQIEVAYGDYVVTFVQAQA